MSLSAPVRDEMLLPCPFCGSDDVHFDGPDGSPFSVVCRNCCAQMPYMSLDDPQSVRWNTRTPASQVEAGEVGRNARIIALGHRVVELREALCQAKDALTGLPEHLRSRELKQSAQEIENVRERIGAALARQGAATTRDIRDGQGAGDCRSGTVAGRQGPSRVSPSRPSGRPSTIAGGL